MLQKEYSKEWLEEAIQIAVKLIMCVNGSYMEGYFNELERRRSQMEARSKDTLKRITNNILKGEIWQIHRTKLKNKPTLPGQIARRLSDLPRHWLCAP